MLSDRTHTGCTHKTKCWIWNNTGIAQDARVRTESIPNLFKKRVVYFWRFNMRSFTQYSRTDYMQPRSGNTCAHYDRSKPIIYSWIPSFVDRARCDIYRTLHCSVVTWWSAVAPLLITAPQKRLVFQNDTLTIAYCSINTGYLRRMHWYENINGLDYQNKNPEMEILMLSIETIWNTIRICTYTGSYNFFRKIVLN